MLEPEIIVTPNATTKITSLLAEEEGSLYFRVYIQGGGCSGFEYGFAFDEHRKPKDHLIEQSNISVVIDPMSLQYLTGAEIDYVDDLQGAHFVIRNPNAQTTCGCGSSFSV